MELKTYFQAKELVEEIQSEEKHLEVLKKTTEFQFFSSDYGRKELSLFPDFVPVEGEGKDSYRSQTERFEAREFKRKLIENCETRIQELYTKLKELQDPLEVTQE